MPGFHHSVAVLPLPFRRSAVVKFRCYVRKFRSVTAVNGKKILVRARGHITLFFDIYNVF